MASNNTQPRVVMDPIIHYKAKIACTEDRTTMSKKADELFGEWLASRSPKEPIKPVKRKAAINYRKGARP